MRAYPLALALALSPLHLAAQIATVDLTGQPLETVIPAEFDGGFFARIAGMVVDDRGIWVVDRGHLTVFGFGPGGNLTAQYGREGSGPGEFLFPSDLKVDSALTVTDPRLGRTVRFSLDGEHLETAQQDQRPVAPEGMEVPLGNVASLPDSSRLDTLASYHIDAGRWDAPERLGGNFEPGLGMSGAWAFVGDTMAVLADGISGTLTRVRIVDGAPVADTFDLGIRARPVSDRDMADIEARLREEKPDLPRRLEFEMADGWSVATAVFPGPDGEFWLRQAVEGEGQEWVVVRPGSARKWRIMLPERFRLSAIHGGYLYGVARDEFDVASVARIADPPR